jgi:hypothetical protein
MVAATDNSISARANHATRSSRHAQEGEGREEGEKRWRWRRVSGCGVAEVERVGSGLELGKARCLNWSWSLVLRRTRVSESQQKAGRRQPNADL